MILLPAAQLFGMLVGHPHAFQAPRAHMLDKAAGRLMITLIIVLLLLVLEAEEGQAPALADFLSISGSSLHIYPCDAVLAAYPDRPTSDASAQGVAVQCCGNCELRRMKTPLHPT